MISEGEGDGEVVEKAKKGPAESGEVKAQDDGSPTAAARIKDGEASPVVLNPQQSIELQTENGIRFTLAPVTAVEGGKKRKREPNIKASSSRSKVAKRGAKAELDLSCEWGDCQRLETTMRDFMGHVRSHLKEVKVLFANKDDLDNQEEKEEDEEDRFICLWLSCGFETPCSAEMVSNNS